MSKRPAALVNQTKLDEATLHLAELIEPLSAARGDAEEILRVVTSLSDVQVRQVQGSGYLLDLPGKSEGAARIGFHVMAPCVSDRQAERGPAKLFDTAALPVAVLATLQRLAPEIGHGGVRVIVEEPADDGASGTQALLASNALAELDRLYGVTNSQAVPHMKIGIRSGVLGPADSRFLLTMQRQPVLPQLTNSLPSVAQATAHTIIALSQIPTRQINPLQPAHITFDSVRAEAPDNAYCGTANLYGRLLTLSRESADQAFDIMDKTVQGLARTFGIDCELIVREQTPAVLADAACVSTIRQAAEQSFGKDAVIDLEFLSNDYEALAQYLEIVPGAVICFGGLDGAQATGAETQTRFLRLGVQCLLRLVLCS